ncbi:FAST kinase domain-containing protein 3, mitochondrial [Octodon degus]|uniref:FAST kinase domain-containing protein 3, mitochondrial n=1 Tax=Octodon degus TaxID=10160 RepID=A0A6P6DL13_OCTDE|nr:FAST kinase domain-containing protein 3, mitochondrial [Octodon degus]
MALTSLWRRNFCQLADVRVCGALAARRSGPANRGRRVAKGRLRAWFCSLQPGSCRVVSYAACGKKFHSGSGNDLHPLSEQGLSQACNWDRLDQNLNKEDERMFYRTLNSLSSWEEVLSFISTLDILPDTMAAGALQRICEVAKGDRDQGLPKGILENGLFQALCFRFEEQPTRLSSTGLVTALQALILMPVDHQSGLILNLVAECQNRLQAGVLEASDLCILGETLIRLQGPGCVALELILHQLQGKKLETFTPENIVATYRLLQTCAEKVDQHQTFLNRINNFCLSVVSYLSPKSVSQVLAALVALDQTQVLPLIIKLGKCVVRHIPRFTSEELGKVLEAFKYFGHSDRFFTSALEQHVAAHCLSLDPEVVSKVTEYCSRRLILSKPILNAVAETFVCQSEKFSPPQIAELVEPFGKLNYLPPNAHAFFRKLENVLFSDFHRFPPKMLLRVLHSCSLVECHPVNFMAKIFSPFFLQQLQDVEIKLDEAGFVLPFTVKEDVHKRIALCLDGPSRFCSNSRHLLGKEAVKQRHLRLLGYRVVQNIFDSCHPSCPCLG